MGMRLEGQVQVFVGQVQSVLQREQLAHVDAPPLAVDMGAPGKQPAHREGGRFGISGLNVERRPPLAAPGRQPLLRIR
ncbi:hypothetical protein D9M68_964330 [compost metagenome]